MKKENWKEIQYVENSNILVRTERNNITVVAYTELAVENGFNRLKKLETDNYFKAVYVSDSLYKHPDTIASSPKMYIVHGKKLMQIY